MGNETLPIFSSGSVCLCPSCARRAKEKRSDAKLSKQKYFVMFSLYSSRHERAKLLLALSNKGSVAWRRTRLGSKTALAKRKRPSNWYLGCHTPRAEYARQNHPGWPEIEMLIGPEAVGRAH